MERIETAATPTDYTAPGPDFRAEPLLPDEFFAYIGDASADRAAERLLPTTGITE
ncbi:MAG: hypothetical protein VX346_19775 [Planctomycetota bacterium]|nr:hypothetical protein [Planctomycetota bacterium]